jgi:hypothetical protein
MIRPLRTALRAALISIFLAGLNIANASPHSKTIEEDVGVAIRKLASDSARTSMRSLASCLVSKTRLAGPRTKMISFLRVSPFSPEAITLGQDLANPSCMPRKSTILGDIQSIRFQPELLRGQIFRAMYLQSKMHPKIGIDPDRIDESWSLDDSDPATRLQKLGDCAIAKDAVGADALVRMKAGSAEETDSYRLFNPVLNSCVEESEEIRFSRAILEGVLSEALYKNDVTSVLLQRAGSY